MFQFFECTIDWTVGWTKRSIVTQELIDIATQHFVSHLLCNIGPNVILGDTPIITFPVPCSILCQNSIPLSISATSCSKGTLTEDWWVSVGRIWVSFGCPDLQRNEKSIARYREDNAQVVFHFWHDSLWQESIWSHDLPRVRHLCKHYILGDWRIVLKAGRWLLSLCQLCPSTRLSVVVQGQDCRGPTCTWGCHGVTILLWNDIELSWKLHLPEHLFRIFKYKFGNVVAV